jgi:hypothetical protein
MTTPDPKTTAPEELTPVEDDEERELSLEDLDDVAGGRKQEETDK